MLLTIASTKFCGPTKMLHTYSSFLHTDLVTGFRNLSFYTYNVSKNL